MPMLLFVIVLLLGLMFLSGAVVVLLVELTHSLVVSMFVVGLFYILLGVALYIGPIHRTLRLWQRRLDTVYDVSVMFEVLYRRAVGYIQKILGSF